MPLITCHECKKQISDQAHTCPHCGHPRKEKIFIGFEKANIALQLQQFAAVILLILGIILTIWNFTPLTELGRCMRMLGIVLSVIGVVWAVFARLLLCWDRE